jgi:rubrerythrin
VRKAQDEKQEEEMDLTTQRMTQALKTAIRREERTAASYLEKARKMPDPAAKSVLESLAKQEQAHARKLQMILDKQMDLSRLGKGGKKTLDTFHVINDDVRKMEKVSEAVKVVQKALVAEENSCKLYRSMEKIYVGLDLGELFGKLAQEEERHVSRLEKVLAQMLKNY